MTDLTRRQVVGAGAGAAVALWLPFAAPARSAEWHARAARARIGRRALAELERRLRGRLIRPGEPGYRARSAPANVRYDATRPYAIARVADEQDVRTCVAWAREHGAAFVARGGGHSYAGFSTTTGLLIDLGRLNSVRVDRRTGRAVVGGAALNGDVLRETVDGDWILPGGTCLGVGIGGLVLGGGIGYNTHWAGLTSDRLRAGRIVTADARARHIDATHHRDLFWACRGAAGGSFGVNTQFEFQLQRIPRRNVAFYRFDWRGADAAAAVLSTFDQVLRTAPAAFNAVAMAQASPVGAGGPREAIDVFSRGQYIGPLEELREIVAPLLAAATPTRQVLRDQPFWATQRGFASTEAERHGFGDISRYSRAPLPAAAAERVVDLLASCPVRTAEENGSMWSLGWVGGDVVDRFDRRDTAYVHRGMLTLLRATPVWKPSSPAAVRRDLRGWTDQMIRVIAPFTPRESYQNFPNRDIRDHRRQYYGENYGRLARIKTAYDPHDVFHNLQSIRPHTRTTA